MVPLARRGEGADRRLAPARLKRGLELLALLVTFGVFAVIAFRPGLMIVMEMLA